MSAPKWTPAQRAAIEDRGGTLLVSAAAGSGKTAVLVERAVRLITDAAHPVAADRLLIVTFTRAAAEELRGRIAVRLAAEAAAHPESAYLRRQRLLLGRANICTIDAFCMQLLKRYFAELGLPPDFELADDAKAYTLRQNALSAVLEELYEDADFCAFASLYGRARSDASAAAAVLGLYDFSRTLPHPAAALQSICAAYESGQPLGQTAWGRTLLENAGRAARSALRLLDAAEKAYGGKLDSPLSPWSPPVYMKTNGERNNGGKLKPEYRKRWAEYICRYIEEYRSRGYHVAFYTFPKGGSTADRCYQIHR